MSRLTWHSRSLRSASIDCPPILYGVLSFLAGAREDCRGQLASRGWVGFAERSFRRCGHTRRVSMRYIRAGNQSTSKLQASNWARLSLNTMNNNCRTVRWGDCGAHEQWRKHACVMCDCTSTIPTRSGTRRYASAESPCSLKVDEGAVTSKTDARSSAAADKYSHAREVYLPCRPATRSLRAPYTHLVVRQQLIN